MARMRIRNPHDLVTHEQVVIGPGAVQLGKVAESGMGASGCHGVLRDGNPAESRLATTGALLVFGDPDLGPGISSGKVVGPQERREGGIYRRGAAVRRDIPRVAVLLGHLRCWRGKSDCLRAVSTTS